MFNKCAQCEFQQKKLSNCTFYQRNSNNAIQQRQLLGETRILPMKKSFTYKNLKYFVYVRDIKEKETSCKKLNNYIIKQKMTTNMYM